MAQVNDLLKQKNLRTWFDSEKMEGNVKKKMINGIDNAQCIIVFVTKRYMKKVAGNNAEDNCQLEFNYSCRRKTGNNMIPVVMEERMLNSNAWTGEVGMVLGGSLYVNLTDDNDMSARVDELHSRILSLIHRPTNQIIQSIDWSAVLAKVLPATAASKQKSVYEDGKGSAEEVAQNKPVVFAASVSAPSTSQAQPALALPSSPPASAPATATGTDDGEELQQQMRAWMRSKTTVVPKFVDKYVALLFDHGVGSIAKLKKKLTNKPNYLVDLGIDEDDAEEIAKAVNQNSDGPTGDNSVSAASPKVQIIKEETKLNIQSYVDRIEMSNNISDFLHCYAEIDSIKSELRVNHPEDDELMVSVFESINRLCTNKATCSQFKDDATFFSTILQYAQMYLSSAAVCEKSVCALKALCRYGRMSDTQVQPNVDKLAQLGICDVIMAILNKWYKNSSTLAFNSMLLVNCLASKYSNSLSKFNIVEILLEIVEMYIVIGEDCNSYVALGVAFAAYNLTGSKDSSILSQFNNRNGFSILNCFVLENPYVSDKDALHWTGVACGTLNKPNIPTTIAFCKTLHNNYQSSGCGKLLPLLHSVGKLCINEAALKEYAKDNDFLKYILEMIQFYASEKSVAFKGMYCIKMLCRYGDKSMHQVTSNVAKMVQLGACGIVVEMLEEQGNQLVIHISVAAVIISTFIRFEQSIHRSVRSISAELYGSRPQQHVGTDTSMSDGNCYYQSVSASIS